MAVFDPFGVVEVMKDRACFRREGIQAANISQTFAFESDVRDDEVVGKDAQILADILKKRTGSYCYVSLLEQLVRCCALSMQFVSVTSSSAARKVAVIGNFISRFA